MAEKIRNCLPVKELLLPRLFIKSVFSLILLTSFSSQAEVAVSAQDPSPVGAVESNTESVFDSGNWQLAKFELGYINAIQSGGSSGGPILIWAPEKTWTPRWSIGGSLGVTGFKDKQANSSYGVGESSLFVRYKAFDSWSLALAWGYQYWGSNHGEASSYGAQIQYKIHSGQIAGASLQSIFIEYRSVNQSPHVDELVAGVGIGF